MKKKGVALDFVRQEGELGAVLHWLERHQLGYDYLRPWHDKDGKPYFTHNVGTLEKPEYKAVPLTGNASSQLREDWLTADNTAIQASKPALRAVGDLVADGMTLTIDAMSQPILSWQTVTDITTATISMDGLRKGENDKPEFGIAYLPIPLIHKDLRFGARELGIQRGGSNPFPIDTDTIAKASRRCAEVAEDMLIGNTAVFTYQGYSVYGYRTHPSRLTKVFTLPTNTGWTPQTLVTEFLAAKQQLRDAFAPGPYRVYISSAWEPYFDDDYSSAYNGNTLRTRLSQIDGVTSIRTLESLTSYQILIIDTMNRTVRMVMGMPLRVLQWPSAGGMEQNYKVMMSMTPQFRPDDQGYLGVLHGTAA